MIANVKEINNNNNNNKNWTISYEGLKCKNNY